MGIRTFGDFQEVDESSSVSKGCALKSFDNKIPSLTSPSTMKIWCLEFGKKRLSDTFQGGIVVAVEVIKAKNFTATLLEDQGAMGADEASSTIDEEGHAIRSTRGVN